MRAARDSFLKFIALNTNLAIHPIRSDPDSPEASVFAMNAVNIKFANVAPAVDVNVQHVNIDVVYDSENATMDAIDTLWPVLSASFSCPLLDYTDPANPQPLGTNNVSWDRYGVKFRAVRSDFYCHYTTSIKLFYHES